MVNVLAAVIAAVQTMMCLTVNSGTGRLPVVG